MPINNDRFMRTRALLGNDKMSRLENATVMIVGLGAVGGYALEGLARAGVGHLILVDFDVIEPTNINRQILALSSTLGQAKTDAARNRVNDINPACQIVTRNLFVKNDNLDDILNLKPDFVIDAIDALNPKCALIEELWRRQIPFISAMGAALKQDSSKIVYGRLSNTKNCALAKFVRKRLKRRNVDLSQIWCVSSTEQAAYPDSALFMDEDSAAPLNTGGRPRHTMGSLPTITAIFGLTAANEAIKRITEGL